jgi:uncharacterized membrane protein YgdD (TMEM256/DUF423 family)
MGRWLAAAGLSGLVAVAVGAFAAHGLAGRLDATPLVWIETAARYQMYHALALLAVALLAREPFGQSPVLAIAGWGFAGGTVLFCGSLYLLALTGLKFFAWLTPLGGLAFLAGWAALARQGFLLWRGPGRYSS